MKKEKKLSLDWSRVREGLGNDTLSVILPVYHLAHEVERNLDLVATCFDAGGFSYELIPVDDGSEDGTAEALRRASQKRPQVKPVWIQRNAGKGNALKEGFRASQGNLILLLDGDLDIAPRYLPAFFDSMRTNNSDIVLGSKRHPLSRVQYPWHRRLASFLYFAQVRLTLGLPVSDTQTGMKLFKRKFLGEALARMLVKTYAFDLELLAIAFERGARISEAPVEISFGQKFGALKPRTVREMMHDTLAIIYRLRILHYYQKVEVPPPLDHEPFVSVVIACPSSSWMLEEALRALARQTYTHFEVLVLPDEPMARPACELAQLTIFPTGKVRPAEKRNYAKELAKGEVLAFLDDDAYPDERWLEHAIKYFSNPEIAGVGGPGVTPPGDGLLARAGGRVYENFFVSGTYRYRYVAGRVLRDVDDYPSCNLFVRADLFRQVGGYRVDFWPGEDTLLCRALVCEEKKRIVYDPWTIVYHHRRKLLLPHVRQLARYAFHRGYFMKRFPENSLHLSYFAPSLFVLYVLLCAVCGAAVACGVMPLVWGLAVCAPLALYVGVVVVSTCSLNVPLWVLTCVGVMATHVVYGVQLMRGLLASQAPCEYIGKDHV